jgi:hypothetical protein
MASKNKMPLAKRGWHRGYEQLCLRLHVRKLVHNQFRTLQLCRRIPARIPIWHLRWLRRLGQQRPALGRVGTPRRVRYSVRSVPFPSFTSSQSDIRYSTAIHLCTILSLHARFICRNYSALYPSANRRPSCLVSIQGIMDFRRRSSGSFAWFLAPLVSVQHIERQVADHLHSIWTENCWCSLKSCCLFSNRSCAPSE